jgi:hypothetical protein
LGALCALALPLGRADLYGFDARSLMRSWDLHKRPAPAAEWTRARESLRAAHALDPRQPAYLEDLARLNEERTRRLPASDPLVREYLREALDLQREALVRRPGSPYTWSNVALLKARLAEADGEFERALRNAALLGPWEPDVQIALADAGFSRWASLSRETREAMRANAARALGRQDERLFEVARRTAQLALLCGLPEVQRSRRATACI